MTPEIVAGIITALIMALVGLSGITVNAVRRNGQSGKGNHANDLLEHFLDNQGRIVIALERMVASDERQLEAMKELAKGQDELVTIHRAMEVRRKVLGRMVEEGGHA